MEVRSVIGVLIVTHYRMAEEFLQALQLIVGELGHFQAIGLDPSSPPETMRMRIAKAMREADTGGGVLMLVDMFGGTPSNLCLSFLDDSRVEVVTGVNLPMLVKVARADGNLCLKEVAELAQEYGRRNISIASDVLEGRKRSEEGS
ncbi:MAG: PTS sugar transporter subunit IIA [Deltaproteobacteria bacterium]|nr:PTS sugar transporter subunit IIA [Deltaproteobacteria bacterium]